MINKLCHLQGTPFREKALIFSSGKELIKQASYLRPDIERFIDKIKSEKNDIWMLVHAIGAGEVYGANRNGDLTLEEALNNVPEQWTGDPELDKAISSSWAYGWPTYYNAYVYANHVNKDPARKIGDVAFVSWDPLMRRVELLIRVRRDLAAKHGGDWALRRLDRGDPIDVSMGMRVPFDLSETETDWAKYNEAVKTFNPELHKSPAQAVLMYQKRDPIRGLAITRKDYTNTVKFHMGEVLPDGRKVCVRNTFPRFFDISLVIIGAERPAKLLWKMASHCEIDGVKCAGKCLGKQCGNQLVPSGALLYDRLEKDAALKESTLKKKSDMEKETPSNFNPKAVAGVSDSEEELPRKILDAMGRRDFKEALSTPSLMGIKLKPREFQRIVLTIRGQGGLADQLDSENKVFAPTDEVMKAPCISHDNFSPAISSMLQQFMPQRSAFEPFIKVRMVKIKRVAGPEPEQSTDGILQKISAAYNGYLEDLRDNFIKESALVLHQNPDLRWELEKAAGEEVKIVVGDLSKAYLGFD